MADANQVLAHLKVLETVEVRSDDPNAVSIKSADGQTTLLHINGTTGVATIPGLPGGGGSGTGIQVWLADTSYAQGAIVSHDGSLWLVLQTTTTEEPPTQGVFEEIVTGETGAFAPASRYENSGADEMSVAGLSGALADPQTPTTHASSHENAGADEISVAGLSGLLADAQTPTAHKTSHEAGGSDAISCVGLVGVAPVGKSGTLDLKSETVQDFFTPAADFYPHTLWIEATVLDTLTGQPIISVGTNSPNYDNIIGATGLDFTAVGDFDAIPLNIDFVGSTFQRLAKVASGTPVKIKVTGGAVATTLSGVARLTGFVP